MNTRPGQPLRCRSAGRLQSAGVPEIVTFQREHAEAIAALCHAEGWDSWDDVERVASALSAPGVTTLAALDEGRVIGAIEVIGDAGINWTVAMLIVAPSHRRRGFGKRLIETAFGATGATRLDLLTEDEGPPFYRRLPGREMRGFRLYPN